MAQAALRGEVLFAALVAPSVGGAQQATGSQAPDPSGILNRAIEAYKNIQIEAAVAMLDTVLMYRSLMQTAERTVAFTYAGAGNAVLGKKNASIRYYREAIKEDADFGPEMGFGATETAAYELARKSLTDGVPDAEFPIGAGSPLFAEIRIGTMTGGADFYVNDTRQGAISAAVYWKVPGNEPIRISIRAPQCLTPWDTALMVPTNERITIGRRGPMRCGQ